MTTDLFHGQGIYRADIAATGPASPVPPGIPRDPGPASTTSPPRSARIVLAFALIVATFPLLRRITGPDTARSE